MTEGQAVTVVVWLGPAQVFGRLLHFRFGRDLSTRAFGLSLLAGLPIALALFALVDHTAGLLLFAPLFGFVNGLLTIFRGAVVPAYFGREHVGRIGGAMSTITAIGGAAFASFMLAGRPPSRELKDAAPASSDRSRTASGSV